MEHHIFLMGKVTISMAIFNSYVSLPEGKQRHFLPQWMSLFWGVMATQQAVLLTVKLSVGHRSTNPAR